MPVSPTLISIGLLLLVSVVVIITSLKRAPGIGVIGALVIIALSTWLYHDAWLKIGFGPSDNWPAVIVLSLLFGALLQLAAVLFLEPLADKLTHSTTDHSAFESLRGNFKALLMWLAMVWVLVAFLEEIIFRGFFMSELASLIGTSPLALAVNVLVSSIVFGFAHWYQGKSGTLSTGVIGAILALLFIWGGFNLWLPILTHGFIDTIGLTMIYLNLDKKLKVRFSKTTE